MRDRCVFKKMKNSKLYLSYIETFLKHRWHVDWMKFERLFVYNSLGNKKYV